MSKYNSGPMIDLNSIPSEEKERALDEFSEGSQGLRFCLSMMWDKGLKTAACCSGHESSFHEAYILMDNGVDIYSYLSGELLSSDMVSISLNRDNNEAIHFVGTQKDKEHFFFLLAKDIATGKKQNAQQVRDKLGRPINQEWLVHGIVYNMLRDNLSKVGPIKRIKLASLCKQLNGGSMEQQRRIMDSCYKELASLQTENRSFAR